MARALHMVDGATPRDCLLQLAMLAGREERILSAGKAPRCRMLAGRIQSVHATMGCARLCGRRMAGLVGAAEIIHVWSATALAAAGVAGRLTGLPVVLSLPWLPEAGQMRRRLEVALAGAVRLTVPTEASRAALVRGGAPPAAVEVLPPPAAAPQDRDRRRKAVREVLGVAESEFLVVAAGEMTRDGGHICAAWAHAMVSHILPGIKLLLPGVGAGFRSTAFFSSRTGFADRVLITGDELGLADALAAADAAVFFHQRDCGVAALAAAMAAGLPIAASETPDVVECTSAGQAALLVRPGEPQPAAAAMLQLIEDRDIARRLAEKAAEIAAERFSPGHSRAALERIHEAAAQSVA